MAERERRRAATLDRATNTFSTAARDFVEQYASKKTRRGEEQARLLGVVAVSHDPSAAVKASSVHGTWRRFVAMQNLVATGGIADIGQARTIEFDL